VTTGLQSKCLPPKFAAIPTYSRASETWGVKLIGKRVSPLVSVHRSEQ